MAFLLQFCLLPNRNTTSGLNRPRPCHTEHPAALYAAPAACLCRRISRCVPHRTFLCTALSALYRIASLTRAECFFRKLDVIAGIFLKALLHHIVDGSFRKAPAFIGLARRDPGQQLNTVVDVVNRINRKLPVLNRFQHVFAQHQIDDIGARNNHALFAGQPVVFADLEKALNFLVNAADGLNLAKLDDRLGNLLLLLFLQVVIR